MGASTSVQNVLHGMTLRQKAAQLVMPRISGEYVPLGSPAHDHLRYWVEELGVGGVIITMGPPLETAAKLNMMQELAAVPLLVCSDMEHGAGQVLTGGVILPYGFENGGATRFPPLMGIGATHDEQLAYALGRVTAVEARAAGVHVVFAPVVDVNSEAANPIINTRSYGADPEFVALMAAAHIRGLQDHGVLSTAKHFPGHGDTVVDSHVDLPRLDADAARLRSFELLPFRVAVDAGVACVMIAHIAFPSLAGDERPATLSPAVVTGLLREELGFDGLVFTDALDMGAVVRRYGAVEAGVLAIEAGVDVLLQMAPGSVAAVIEGLVAAVGEGRITEARLDRSVRRVLDAKHRLGLHEGALTDIARLPAVAGAPANTAAAEHAARRSITIVRDDGGLLPVHGKVLTIVYTGDYDPFAGRAFLEEVATLLPGSEYVRLDARSDADQLAAVAERARAADRVILAPFVRVVPGKPALTVADTVAGAFRDIAGATDAIMVSFGSPYLLTQFPEVGTFVAAWGAWEPMQSAAARAITGRAPADGRLPAPLAPYCRTGDGMSLPRAQS